MPENKVKQLTFGAMMTGLFILLSFLSAMPLLAIITVWFIPLPIILYILKYNLKSSIGIVLIGCLGTFLLTGPLVIGVSLVLAVIGMTIGAKAKSNRSKLEILLSTALTAMITVVATIYASSKFMGINILEVAMKSLRTGLNSNVKLSEELAKTLNQKSTFTQEHADILYKAAENSLPSALILSSLLMALLIIIVNFPIIKKIGYKVPKFGAIKDIRFPGFFLLGYLVVLLIQFFIKPEEGTYLYFVALNASLLLDAVFLIQGISFIHFMVHRSNLPKALAWIGTIFAFPLASFVSILGILDIGLNLRILLGDKTKK